METRNDLLLDENQHRLLMCCRMAKALGEGEVFLDMSGPRMCWRIDKNRSASRMFASIGDVEEYLEHLLENRWEVGAARLTKKDPSIRRRMDVMRKRMSSRTNGTSMVFPSRINL